MHFSANELMLSRPFSKMFALYSSRQPYPMSWLQLGGLGAHTFQVGGHFFHQLCGLWRLQFLVIHTNEDSYKIRIWVFNWFQNIKFEKNRIIFDQLRPMCNDMKLGTYLCCFCWCVPHRYLFYHEPLFRRQRGTCTWYPHTSIHWLEMWRGHSYPREFCPPHPG